MQFFSRHASTWLFTALAVVMVATRYHHLGSWLHLPDASMAVFFLGGLYLRKHLGFILLLALSVGVDWASVSVAGNSAFCITGAYAFLPLAYAALWYAGRWFAPHTRTNLRGLFGCMASATVAASVSFTISNGSFFWLGGVHEPVFSAYLANFWQYAPSFVGTTVTYVAVALVGHALAVQLAKYPMQRAEGV